MNTTIFKEREIVEVEQFLPHCTLEVVVLLMIRFLENPNLQKKNLTLVKPTSSSFEYQGAYFGSHPHALHIA
jgi:hypothetical protein